MIIHLTMNFVSVFFLRSLLTSFANEASSSKIAHNVDLCHLQYTDTEFLMVDKIKIPPKPIWVKMNATSTLRNYCTATSFNFTNFASNKLCFSPILHHTSKLKLQTFDIFQTKIFIQYCSISNAFQETHS